MIYFILEWNSLILMIFMILKWNFVIFMILIWILPRMTDSLHPGNGGNPGFSKYDLDSNMRLVFYPAIIAWTLLGYWIANLRIRIKKLEHITSENE